MDEPKINLKQRLIALTVNSMVFLAVYQLAGLYTSGLTAVPSFVFPIERHIPFLPWMIVPYMSSGLFFMLVFFAVKREEELRLLSRRMLFITLVSGICFFLFPLRFSFVQPLVYSPFFDFFFQYLNTWDTPFNQAPSLHIAYACLFWSVFSNRLTGYGKILVGIWLVLMGVSTLTVYQHHLIDVITALGLVCVTFFLFPGRLPRNKRIAAIYFFAALCMVTLLLFFYPKSFILDVFMVWLAVTFVRVGKAYVASNARFLKRKDGTISLPDKIICAPYILSYRLIRYVICRNKIAMVTEIHPRVFMGPMPDRRMVQSIPVDRNTKIIDLTAEVEECKAIRAGTAYYSCPLLDISSANKADMEEIARLVAKLYVTLNANEKIYIHCLMGRYRCALLRSTLKIESSYRSDSET